MQFFRIKLRHLWIRKIEKLGIAKCYSQKNARPEFRGADLTNWNEEN
jgi:hypothetical protein